MNVLRNVAALLAGLLPAVATPLQAADTDFQVPVVVDSSGRLFGPLIEATSAVIDVAPNSASSHPVQVNLGTGGVYSYALRLYYATEDCSGPAYLQMENVPPFASADPADKNALIYASTTVARRQVRSRNTLSQSPCRTLPAPANPQVALVERTSVSGLGYTPPFRVRFQALPAAAPGVRPRPFAVDSAGKVVGAVFNSGHDRTVTAQSFDFVLLRLTPSNALVRIGVGRDGFETGALPPRLEYLTKDCTGQAYFAPISGPFARPAFVDGATGAILFPAANVVQFVAQSVRYDAGAGYECHPYSKPSSTLGERVLSTTLADQGFSPPFTIILH